MGLAGNFLEDIRRHDLVFFRKSSSSGIKVKKLTVLSLILNALLTLYISCFMTLSVREEVFVLKEFLFMCTFAVRPSCQMLKSNFLSYKKENRI